MANPRTKEKATILVIEDNADQWFIIRWALQRGFPEVEPIWFSEPAQAILYLESCTQVNDQLPRLILLDLYLPSRETGWTMLQTLKTHYLYREIPVVILSCSADKEDITESYLHRSNSYIVKPTVSEKWVECFATFRHYWWEAVTLPSLV